MSVREWLHSLFMVAPLLPTAELEAARRGRKAATRLHAGAARHAGEVSARGAHQDVMPDDVIQARDEWRGTLEELIRRTR